MKLRKGIKESKENDNPWIGLFRDLIFVVTVIVVISIIFFIAFGLFSPMVAVESKSMYPHLKVGDIIFIESADRTTIVTAEEGKNTGYSSFEYFGDVILYRRSGNDVQTPVIHRAMYYVQGGEPMWPGGPSAPYGGYITKGDNNAAYDQQGSVSYLQPIRAEQIIGVAKLGPIPVLGCISLTLRGNLACFTQ